MTSWRLITPTGGADAAGNPTFTLGVRTPAPAAACPLTLSYYNLPAMIVLSRIVRIPDGGARPRRRAGQTIWHQNRRELCSNT